MSRFVGGEKIQSGDKEWQILGTENLIHILLENFH